MSCKVEGCDKEATRRGLCWKHYNELRASKPEDLGKYKWGKIGRCEVDGCATYLKVA